jgi:hypothetical protein
LRQLLFLSRKHEDQGNLKPTNAEAVRAPLKIARETPVILTRTGNRTVAGLPGWAVEERFPSGGLEYREGGKVMVFDSEMASGPGTAIILYYQPRDTWWKPPHRDRPLTAAEQHPILVRATAALLLLGITPIWEAIPAEAARTDWPVIWEEAKAYLRRAE